MPPISVKKVPSVAILLYVSHTTIYLCRVLLNRWRPSMPPISVDAPVRGPLLISPRSDGALSFMHDSSSEEAHFVLRLYARQKASVELQLVYGYGQNSSKLWCTAVHQLSQEGADLAAKASAAVAVPTNVANHDVWAAVKALLAFLST